MAILMTFAKGPNAAFPLAAPHGRICYFELCLPNSFIGQARSLRGIPIIVPMVLVQGYYVIWFGILMIVLIEMALITPPVGLNLYVVQGARKSGRLYDVMLGVIPFVLVMLAMIALLVAVPSVALFLPDIL